MKMIEINVNINGIDYAIKVDPCQSALEFLRDVIGLTGVKEGCQVGECGACTIIVNDDVVNSCLLLAPQLEDKKVTTIEGLSYNEGLDPIQQAFIDKGAIQCGFCTPGMILSAKAFLNINSQPSENQIKEAIVGNTCRCTGYKQIIEAIMYVANMKSKGE